MRRRQAHKLTLTRDTIRRVATTELGTIAGGTTSWALCPLTRWLTRQFSCDGGCEPPV